MLKKILQSMLTTIIIIMMLTPGAYAGIPMNVETDMGAGSYAGTSGYPYWVYDSSVTVSNLNKLVINNYASPSGLMFGYTINAPNNNNYYYYSTNPVSQIPSSYQGYVV